LKKNFPNQQFELTGEMRRKMDIVNLVEILIDGPDTTSIRNLMSDHEGSLKINDSSSGPYSLRGNFNAIDLKWQIRFTNPSKFHAKRMLSTGSGKHLAGLINDGKTMHQYLLENDIDSEDAAYKAFDSPYIEPELREGTFEIDFSGNDAPPELLELNDLKGPIHNHSNYSDGANPIRQLANYCMDKGYEYLGLSDHSKSAFYADGLREFDIIKQHEEIDKLNQEYAPFRIFKGIESDILNDGSLDYEPDVLASFDFIVASIHSNLNMNQEKATQRLLKAIENPYTTMLGHPTGRLLLKRKAYPIDHKKIIDACAKHKVIIEINANPWRLDLEWQWVNYAISQGVILSINPDAHEIDGFEDMKYGVYIGRKGGLTKELTFNAWGLERVEKYLANRKAGIV
jgi:DNA polymerase (family 10)